MSDWALFWGVAALLCAAAAFLTMEVNGIPMRLALEILADALRAGLF